MSPEYQKKFELEMRRSKLEADEGWRNKVKEIPFLQFPPNCEVQIIPPFGGALARFIIRKQGSDKSISVYFDYFSRLGCMDRPYWELYPNVNDDTSRYYLGEEAELMEEIKTLLN